MKAFITTVVMSLIIVISSTGKNISGIVTSKTDGLVIAGVQIKNGTITLAVTDIKGRYNITATAGDVLTFASIGYETQQITVSKSTTQLNVQLKEQVNQLDEVLLTSMHSKKEEQSISTGQVFQGRLAGLAVQTKNDKARNSKQLVIRGLAPASNTESYASFSENKFLNPLKAPLSTFAADVDVASYNTIKRFIRQGSVPPVDAVRIEEMINYFQYNVDAPRNNDPVHIKTELTHSPWSKGNQLLRITLKAKNVPSEKLPASNFVFLIDISGSMSSLNKLPLVKSSYKLLVDQLRPQDKIAIVTYAGQSNVALESTSGDKKMKIKEVIEGLQAGGGTAGGDGLKMAYTLARQNFIKDGNNRIVMATDGDFNVGASSDADMEQLITKERESGINISILGYGMGNYKDSKLETLANKGRGNYGYINDIAEARKAIISEFGGTLFTVAKDVKIQVEFNPKYVQAYRLVGYENRLMEAEDFNNDHKIGGDMGVGHTVTALYEVVPTGLRSQIIGTVDPLKYQDNKAIQPLNSSSELATVKFRYKEPKGGASKLKQQVVQPQVIPFNNVSEDLRFMLSVAEMGMLLRNSEYKQDANFDSLIGRAKSAKGKDDEGYRAEFIRLAEDAKALLKSNEMATK